MTFSRILPWAFFALPLSSFASQNEGGSAPVPTLCSSAIQSDSRNGLRVSLRESPCEGYTTEQVNQVRFVINDVVERNRIRHDSPPIYPSCPEARQGEIIRRNITDPASGRRRDPIFLDASFYDLPRGWTYRLSLHRVPRDRINSSLIALESLSRTRLYDRQPMHQHRSVATPYIFDGDNIAHFARMYDLREPSVREGIYLQDWVSMLRGEILQALWAECTVEVSDQWFPTREASRLVRPIALQTSAGLYFFGQEARDEWIGGGTIDAFGGRVFDLSRCRNLDRCAASVSAVFSAALDGAFRSAPILAARESRMRPPGQLRYVRTYASSGVLRGFRGPYYEISTYTLFMWTGPRGGFLGGTHLALSARAPDRRDREHLFLQVSQALQVGVGRQGDYEEPTAQQYAAYSQAIQGAISQAVQATTTRLHGRMAEGVGVISDIN